MFLNSFFFFAFLAELALKARKEIADYIQLNKYDRARIRVSKTIIETP